MRSGGGIVGGASWYCGNEVAGAGEVGEVGEEGDGEEEDEDIVVTGVGADLRRGLVGLVEVDLDLGLGLEEGAGRGGLKAGGLVRLDGAAVVEGLGGIVVANKGGDCVMWVLTNVVMFYLREKYGVYI